MRNTSYSNLVRPEPRLLFNIPGVLSLHDGEWDGRYSPALSRNAGH